MVNEVESIRKYDFEKYNMKSHYSRYRETSYRAFPRA